jgi:hypothetical protein
MTIPSSKLLSRIPRPKLTDINQDISTRDTAVRRRTLDCNRTEEEQGGIFGTPVLRRVLGVLGEVVVDIVLDYECDTFFEIVY